MNRGLFGTPWRDRLGDLCAFFREGALPAAGGASAAPNPFGMPVVARSILRCVSPVNGFSTGDCWHTPFTGANSTVNTTEWGYTRNDAMKVATISGPDGSQSGRYGLFVDGTTNAYVPLANFREVYVLVGPKGPRAGVSHLPSLQRFTTPPRPCAAAANYVEKNLLGRPPAFVNVLYKCINPELGYAVGDIVDRGHFQQGGSSTVSDCIRTNERIVELRTPVAGDYYLPRATTGAVSFMSPTFWQVFLEVIG
ncbi:MAG TPA: hypothetical protein VHA35_20545 [Dongiaceae bacterium]|jgi:hypothetical protein|nr:hypothetical protein [Dongiaceae bacterium]